ncbi:MAG: hypothetical protein IPM03_18305 [Sulfuritalea sp.]|nr:hypothetical protein [Sulfuritalea sp.]
MADILTFTAPEPITDRPASKLSGIGPLMRRHFRDLVQGLAAVGGDQENRFVALMRREKEAVP